MAVRPGDVVGPRRPDDLRTEQVDFRGPTGAGRTADRDDGDGGLDEVGCHGGKQRQDRGGGIATGDGNTARVAQRVAVAGQLGQPVGPATGVRRAVEALPRGRVAQSEIGAAVHHQGLRAELLGQGRRVSVRQTQKYHVVAVEHLELGGLEHPLGHWQQMRMMLGERGAGAGGGRERADRQPSVVVGRMREQ